MEYRVSKWNRRGAVVFSLMVALLSSAANAVNVPAFFGWNYVEDNNGGAPLVMDLTSFTYFGGALGNVQLQMPVPAFPAYTGMPDQVGLAFIPTFTTAPPNGDGETTRTIGNLLNIDWVPANTGTPWLPGGAAGPGVPYRSIGISAFTTNNAANGVPWGNYAFSNTYVVGLIENGVDTELTSMLLASRGDIYSNLVGSPGNPVGFATNVLVPNDTAGVIFAAAVPEPSEYALLLAGLGVVGMVARAKRRRRQV